MISGQQAGLPFGCAGSGGRRGEALASAGVEHDWSRPQKPTDNAFIESLNGKFRAECLSAHWFLSLADARRKCERWRRDYNDVRPHSAIGYETPAALVKRSSATSPP